MIYNYWKHVIEMASNCAHELVGKECDQIEVSIPSTNECLISTQKPICQILKTWKISTQKPICQILKCPKMKYVFIVSVIGLTVIALMVVGIVTHFRKNSDEPDDVTPSPIKNNPSLWTPIPLTPPIVSSEVNCHIYRNNPQASDEAKSCRETSISASCSMLLENLNAPFPNRNQGKSINCCKAASKCNQEAYCGQGQMMCLDRSSMETAECVCNRGWQGPRCDICIPKVKVSCWCSLTNHQRIKHISGMPCSSSDAVPTGQCWIHHEINGQNLTCVCHQASDGTASIPETRCSEDKMPLCGD